jgi:hypothetical protein
VYGAVVEVVLLLLIIRYAWKWRVSTGAPNGWGSRDGELRGVQQTRDQNAH